MAKNSGSLIWIERFGILCLISGIIYAVATALQASRRPSEVPATAQEAEALPNDTPQVTEARDLLPEVDSLATARDIFSPAAASHSPTVAAASRAQAPSQFKVVGVVLGKDPQVILEDTAARKTIFVSRSPSPEGLRIDTIGEKDIIIRGRDVSLSVPIGDQNAL